MIKINKNVFCLYLTFKSLKKKGKSKDSPHGLCLFSSAAEQKVLRFAYLGPV